MEVTLDKSDFEKIFLFMCNLTLLNKAGRNEASYTQKNTQNAVMAPPAISQ